MARRHCALCCRPQPVARFLAVFPKLAVLFLIIHVSAMIYSVFKPAPTKIKYTEANVPAGVNDANMVTRNVDSLIVKAIQPMDVTFGNKTNSSHILNNNLDKHSKKRVPVKLRRTETGRL